MEGKVCHLITTLLLSLFFVRCTNVDNNTAAAKKDSLSVTATAGVQGTNNVPAYLSNLKEFSTFFELVKKAGLAETLNKPGPFTVFAPSNKVFEKLPVGEIKNLTAENNEAIQDFVGSHIVAGSVDMDDLENQKVLNTISGNKITITRKNNLLLINGKALPGSFFSCNNGIVYSIDALLTKIDGKPAQ